MKILIRCDSSLKIGTGHLVRCLNLAGYLSTRNIDVVFVCRSLEGNVISLIREKQFKIRELDQPEKSYISGTYNDTWLQVPLTQEIHDFRAVLESENPDWVIVDHYGLGELWEQSIRDQGIKVFVIDDIFRSHRCEVFLDQNFHKNHRQKVSILNSDTETELFLGPHYALLSNEFTKIEAPFETLDMVKQILVFFGGTDLTGETLRMLKFIDKLKGDYNFHFVVGRSNPSLEDIKRKSSSQKNVTLHIQTSEMAKLMAESDLFVGSGGTVTWERCKIGLPGICVSVAENQVEMSQSLHEEGIHLYLGRSHEISDDAMISAIDDLSANYKLRKKMSENSSNLKVASKLKELVETFK